MILALDLAKQLGYARSDGICGSVELGDRADRPLDLWVWLHQYGMDVTTIVVERAAGFHKNALISLGEQHGVVRLFCGMQGVRFEQRSATAIKKHATGNGNATKEEMLDAAVAKWFRRTVVDDNAADALWLLDLFESEDA